ncbi:MAG: hypothetical protein WA890_06290 [Micromonospora sp.]
MRLAAALNMKLFTGKRGGVFLSRPAQADRTKEVGGELDRNYLADPQATGEEQSLLDDYDIVWDLGYTGRDREVQLQEAQLVFDEIASEALWPAALVAGLDILVAAWDPRLGLTRFPPGTSPDGDQRSVWEPYARDSSQG